MYLRQADGQGRAAAQLPADKEVTLPAHAQHPVHPAPLELPHHGIWTHVTTSGLQPCVSICSNTSLAFCHCAPAGQEGGWETVLRHSRERGLVASSLASGTHSINQQERGNKVGIAQTGLLTLGQSGDERVVPAAGIGAGQVDW